VQALSGTGGLRVMGDLLKKHGHRGMFIPIYYGKKKNTRKFQSVYSRFILDSSPSEIHIPNPSWGNHKAIFTVRTSSPAIN